MLEDNSTFVEDNLEMINTVRGIILTKQDGSESRAKALTKINEAEDFVKNNELVNENGRLNEDNVLKLIDRIGEINKLMMVGRNPTKQYA